MLTCFLFLLSSLQDYHNIRAAAFNSHIQELAKRKADFVESRSKHSIFFLLRGCVSAPTGCSPRDSGRLLSSRAESSRCLLVFSLIVDRLFFLVFAETNAALRQELGEARTALHAKEAECSKAAEERDRLAKELADQADRHKAALQKAKDNETGLLAEFETERSNWGEEKKALTGGYSEIEDRIDGELLLPLHGLRLLMKSVSSF